MEGNGNNQAAIPDKNLFRIGEVSRLTSTKPFVLRFWETEFPTLQPAKSPKGHRLYRRADIETVLVIKRLLYDEGFTIAGARRHLSGQPGEPGSANGAHGMHAAPPHTPKNGSEHVSHSAQAKLSGQDRKALLALRDSLRSLLTSLESE